MPYGLMLAEDPGNCMFVGTQNRVVIYTKVGRLNYCWNKLHLLDDTPSGWGMEIRSWGLDLTFFFRITILAFN